MILMGLQIDWGGLITFILSWISLFVILGIVVIVYKVIAYGVGRSLKKKQAESFESVLKFFLRIIFIIIGFGTFISLSDSLIPISIPTEVTIIISTATGTIIALSTTTVVQNFIAGMYIIATRPFKLGDYIRIGDQEGIVSDISLNHTILERRSGTHHHVSNLTILNTRIINFTIPYTSKEKCEETSIKKKERIGKKQITRYVFTMEMPKENPERTKKYLEEICDKHAKTFHVRPTFVTTAFVHKVAVSFVLQSRDPWKILREKDQFIEDIYSKVFTPDTPGETSLSSSAM